MKSFRVLWENRGFVSFAFVLFVVGVCLGYLFSAQLFSFLSSALENVKHIGEQARNKSAFEVGLLLFSNNIRVCIAMVLFGVLLSIPSILLILLNGALIGFLFASMGKAQIVSLTLLFVFGILPHGIFEIPAFVISGAFGMKLGYVLLRPLIGKNRLESLGHVWKEALWVAPIVVMLLMLAAAIESYVTPVLLKNYVLL